MFVFFSSVVCRRRCGFYINNLTLCKLYLYPALQCFLCGFKFAISFLALCTLSLICLPFQLGFLTFHFNLLFFKMLIKFIYTYDFKWSLVPPSSFGRWQPPVLLPLVSDAQSQLQSTF